MTAYLVIGSRSAGVDEAFEFDLDLSYVALFKVCEILRRPYPLPAVVHAGAMAACPSGSLHKATAALQCGDHQTGGS